ncbi:hypothetical protein LTS15_003854 [Exophiala xenobiotica]|nr:hypothetical protein LTS15_003854 [Exophiala xenobiotica]
MATNNHTGKKPIKVASISGYSGDRLDALATVLTGPIEVDAIVGDYLAEMNLSWRRAEMEQGISDGQDPIFVKTLQTATKQLGERLRAGTFPKLVVNAGALNPRQLALDVQQFFLSEFGDLGKALKIAYVTGDNVLSIIRDQQTQKTIKNLNNAETLDTWPYEPVIANAYIGQFGFVEALRGGADVVLAGRTTDAGAIQSLATWYYDWNEEDYDNHALGLIAGHIIECGNYVTGGNFCGFKRVKPYHSLAYPIAEIYNDGHCIITKQPGQNGIVDLDTVRSQLVYEIQGRYYYNPDVIADLSTLKVKQEGPDRVHVSGFKGLPPPKTLKVAIQAYAGFQAEIMIWAMGLDIGEKAKSVEEQVRREFVSASGKTPFRKLEIQLIGNCAPDPRSSLASTAVIRVFAQAAEKEQLSTANFQYKIVQNLGASFPGFTPSLEYLRTAQPRPYLAYFPALIDRSRVDMVVHWLNSDEVKIVPHSTGRLSDPFSVEQENYEPENPVELKTFGPTTRIPLGYQIFARSGDKGANVNVGLFPQGDSQEEWDWLRSTLTTNKVLELLGDDAQTVSRVERVEFPNIKSVHFVLFGMLGGGVTDTARPDSLGKGLAEFLRAKVVDYPEKLYRGFENRI